MNEDEYRVEVELGDDEGDVSLGERISSLDLDDEARERLGSRVVVTRDGPHLFCYAGTRQAADEAARVIGRLLSDDSLAGSVRVTRWHPIAQDWEDADLPLPEGSEAVAAEQRARAEREAHEDPGLHKPSYVLFGSYKPKFLRDLGL